MRDGPKREKKKEKEKETRARGRISPRVTAAAALCKLSRALLRKAGRGGTALPGKLAMLIKKEILADTASGMEVLVVTGTNGKTTTAHMLEHALTCAGRNVLSNRSGANLLSGITAEFASATDRYGRPLKETAVVECDEGALHQVVPLLRPGVIVVTNLFRDQLDRYGEVMHTREAILEGIRLVPDSVLCLNADDSLVASIAREVPNPVLWFGTDLSAGKDAVNAGESFQERSAEKDVANAEESFQDLPGREYPAAEAGAGVSDARYCIHCGKEYRYHYRTYAHLGDYYCPSCGFARMVPQAAVTSIDELTAAGSRVHMRILDQNVQLWISVPAVYNLYNAAAAVCACMAAGYAGHVEHAGHTGLVEQTGQAKHTGLVEQTGQAEPAGHVENSGLMKILDSLGSFSGGFGRMETFRLDGVGIRMILVKNPAGFDQAVDYICGLHAPFTAVLCLNDLDADGHDVSWIWDADYERLCADRDLRRIYVWGRRAADLQLRLKYAGADEKMIRYIPGLGTLLQKMRRSPDPVFVLPNYTTMLPLRDALRKATGKEGFWEG